MEDPVLIGIDSVEEADTQAFAGRVLVGLLEACRTVGVYGTRAEALHATAYFVAGVLGPRLAREEWRALNGELRALSRRDLQSGPPGIDGSP